MGSLGFLEVARRPLTWLVVFQVRNQTFSSAMVQVLCCSFGNCLFETSEWCWNNILQMLFVYVACGIFDSVQNQQSLQRGAYVLISHDLPYWIIQILANYLFAIVLAHFICPAFVLSFSCKMVLEIMSINHFQIYNFTTFRFQAFFTRYIYALPDTATIQFNNSDNTIQDFVCV